MGFLGNWGFLGKHGGPTAEPWPSRQTSQHTIVRGAPVRDVWPCREPRRTRIAAGKSDAEGGGSEQCLRNRLYGSERGSSDRREQAWPPDCAEMFELQNF
jgi:hypothetical protein